MPLMPRPLRTGDAPGTSHVDGSCTSEAGEDRGAMVPYKWVDPVKDGLPPFDDERLRRMESQWLSDHAPEGARSPSDVFKQSIDTLPSSVMLRYVMLWVGFVHRVRILGFYAYPQRSLCDGARNPRSAVGTG